MSGKKSAKNRVHKVFSQKKKKRRVNSNKDNGSNVFQYGGVRTSQLSTMASNMGTQNTNMGMSGMLGQFMNIQAPTSSIQGQIPAPIMFSSYSPPPPTPPSLAAKCKRTLT